jgi:dephospho-CoA kinase
LLLLCSNCGVQVKRADKDNHKCQEKVASLKEEIAREHQNIIREQQTTQAALERIIQEKTNERNQLKAEND